MKPSALWPPCLLTLMLAVGFLPAQDTKPEQKPQPQESAQPQAPNTIIVVTASRMDIPLNESPAATAVVSEQILDKTMQKGIAAEEAFKLIPGMKVDNQADGERVHMSIRGQGLLTERGIRGIKVLVDGLPLNDPTGFAPDLFDVDWLAVRRVEVFRGPASALYGGGAAGGVLNIMTKDGGTAPVSGDTAFLTGSYGFYKLFSEAGGTEGKWNYRVSASHTAADGYRVHTAYDANNFYGKFTWTPNASTRLTAIIGGTNFFNENAEGLNQAWLAEDRRMANPDALTYNEFQRTRRITSGLVGHVQMTDAQDVSFSVYYRNTLWHESVPSSVQHRTYDTPGGIFQYNIHSGKGWLKNHFSLGTDLDWQSIDDYRNGNVGGVEQVTAPRLAQQQISQRGLGFYFLDRVELGPQWNVMFDVRSDRIHNELTDQLKSGGVDNSGKADFTKTTGRVGVSWNPDSRFGLYSSWGQGFLPPATEELANNPDAFGGFNKNLVPATSWGEEFGARGALGKKFFYDVAFFHLKTDNDFGRYRVPSRPLETFYQNAASSRRYGLENSFSWYPVRGLAFQVAYTFSDFKYIDVKSLFGNFQNSMMPNSPRNQAYADLEYTIKNNIILGLASEVTSRAYVDQTNQMWAGGYSLLHPRIGYRWRNEKLSGEITLTARNVTGKEYIAFTEPDPDGNSFQPAPTREILFSARFFLGRPQ